MKNIIIIILIFQNFAFADMDQYQPDVIKDCDEITWVTPTYEKPYQYMMINLPKNEVFHKLVGSFSVMTIRDDVDEYFLEERSVLDGYLVFKKAGNVVSVLKIEPNPTNRRSVRYCEMLLQNDEAIVMIKYGGFLRAFIANDDFREIIKKIKRPQKPNKEQLTKVYVGCK